MKKNSQTYFTTGEFAKLCGVNKRTLFHYHDIGLFHPAIVDDNGYRYYSYHQFDVFAIISILKELNVPLKDMKTYLDERTPERMLALSGQKILEINKEIDKLNQLKHLLEETILYTNKGLNADCEKIIIEEQKEEYLVRSNLLDEDNTKDYITWMLEFTSFENNTQSKDTSFVGTMLGKDTILKGNYSYKSYYFAKTNKKPSQSITVKPKGLYAITYHRGSYETIGRTYERLLNFLEKNNFSLGEFAYEEYILDEVAVKSENDYITQITIPVSVSSSS